MRKKFKRILKKIAKNLHRMKIGEIKLKIIINNKKSLIRMMKPKKKRML